MKTSPMLRIGGTILVVSAAAVAIAFFLDESLGCPDGAATNPCEAIQMVGGLGVLLFLVTGGVLSYRAMKAQAARLEDGPSEAALAAVPNDWVRALREIHLRTIVGAPVSALAVFGLKLLILGRTRGPLGGLTLVPALGAGVAFGAWALRSTTSGGYRFNLRSTETGETIPLRGKWLWRL